MEPNAARVERLPDGGAAFLEQDTAAGRPVL